MAITVAYHKSVPWDLNEDLKRNYTCQRTAIVFEVSLPSQPSIPASCMLWKVALGPRIELAVRQSAARESRRQLIRTNKNFESYHDLLVELSEAGREFRAA